VAPAEFALVCEIGMSNRSKIILAATEIPTYLRLVRQRRPAIVALAATLLAGTIVIGAILLRDRTTEIASLPAQTYKQCAHMHDDASRLACFDEVSRQTSLRSAKDVRRMSFGELLGAQRSDQARNTSAAPKEARPLQLN
jgi:hypothetical protein